MKNPINMWKFPIKKQLELRREMKKNFKSKKFKRNTKILEYAKRFI